MKRGQTKQVRPTGRWVQRVRLLTGLGQREFAERSGVDRAHVGRWERAMDPGLANMRKIRAAFPNECAIVDANKDGESADRAMPVSDHPDRDVPAVITRGTRMVGINDVALGVALAALRLVPEDEQLLKANEWLYKLAHPSDPEAGTGEPPRPVLGPGSKQHHG